MKISKFLTLPVMVFFLSWYSDDNAVFGNNCIDGQGAVVSEIRSSATFHSIKNTAVADVFLTRGPQEALRITSGKMNI